MFLKRIIPLEKAEILVLSKLLKKCMGQIIIQGIRDVGLAIKLIVTKNLQIISSLFIINFYINKTK